MVEVVAKDGCMCELASVGTETGRGEGSLLMRMSFFRRSDFLAMVRTKVVGAGDAYLADGSRKDAGPGARIQDCSILDVGGKVVVGRAPSRRAGRHAATRERRAEVAPMAV